MYYDTLKGSGLKAVLRSTCGTAMAKFIGNATVVLDQGERAEQAQEALAEHKAMYTKAHAELMKHVPSEFDLPNTFEETIDLMIRGKEIKQADIDRLASAKTKHGVCWGKVRPPTPSCRACVGRSSSCGRPLSLLKSLLCRSASTTTTPCGLPAHCCRPASASSG